MTTLDYAVGKLGNNLMVMHNSTSLLIFAPLSPHSMHTIRGLPCWRTAENKQENIHRVYINSGDFSPIAISSAPVCCCLISSSDTRALFLFWR